jgi:hypothetical protein
MLSINQRSDQITILIIQNRIPMMRASIMGFMKTSPGHQKSIKQIYTFSTWNINITLEKYFYRQGNFRAFSPAIAGVPAKTQIFFPTAR